MDQSTSDHTHPPSRQQAAVGGSRASSKATHAPSAKLWKQVNVHCTLRPLLGPPRARSLHSTSLPYCGYVGGPDDPACMVSGCSLAPKDHLTRLCDSVRPASSQVQGHPPHSSEGSRCPWLVRGISVLLAKDVMVPVPPADMKAGFFSPYFIVPKKSGGLRPILGLGTGYTWPWSVSRDAYEVSTYWSVRTALRPLRTSTDKVVYAPVACRNSPATSSSGVGSIWGRFAPFIFRACSTGQPTSCHELCSPENGDSIPRRSSWFATFWTRTGRPVRVPRDVTLPVVLLPNRRNTRHGRTGTQLAAGPSQICISPSEPSRTDSVQGQRGRGAGPARGTILAYQDLVPRADAPRDSPSLADSSEEGSTDSETGHLMAPASRPLETSCLVPRRDAEVLGDLPQEVVETITSARAPVYETRLRLEVEPVRRMVLFSQRRPPEMPDQSRAILLAARVGGLSPSTLKVYVAAIAANHWPCGREVGGEAWLGRQFLRGARRQKKKKKRILHAPPLYPLGTCP